MQESQKGQDIFNLLPLVKARGSHYGVGDALLYKGLLYLLRQVGASHQNRYIFKPITLFLQPFYLFGNPKGFLLLAFKPSDQRFLPEILVGFEPGYKGNPLGVAIFYHRVGYLQNYTLGAVIPLQFNHLGGEIFFKPQDVFRIGTPPLVDGLVGVPHRANVVFGYKLYKLVLDGVGILIFVHQDVLKVIYQFFPHRRVFLQQFHRKVEEVAKIQGV